MKLILVFKKEKRKIYLIGAYSSLEKAEKYIDWMPFILEINGVKIVMNKAYSCAKKGYIIFDELEIDKDHDKLVIE